MRCGGAFGTGIGVGEANRVTVGVQSGTLSRSELGEGGAEGSRELGLRGRDLRGTGLEDFVGQTVGCILLDRGGVDGANYGLVLSRVDGVVGFQVRRYTREERRLEERDPAAGSWARVAGDEGVGRVGRAEGAYEELLTEHGEVFADGEDFAFGMEVSDVGFEDGAGGNSEGGVLNNLKVLDGGQAGPREPDRGGVGDNGFY